MAWNQQYSSGSSFYPAYPSQSQRSQSSQRTYDEPNFGGERSTEREAREDTQTATSQTRQEQYPGLSQLSGFQPSGNGQWGHYYQANGYFYPAYATSQGSTRPQLYGGLTSEQTSGAQAYPQGGHINPAFFPQPPVANYGQAAATATSNTLTTGYGGAYSGFGPAYNRGQWSGYGFGYETNQVPFPYSQTHKASWQQSWAQYGNAIQQNQDQAQNKSGVQKSQQQQTHSGQTRYALRSSHGPPSEPKGVHDPFPARLVNPTYTRSLQLTPSGENPRLYLLPRPEPSKSYLERALVPPHRLSQPKKLLIVLDLNGTLLLREGKGTKHTPRPNVHEFLRYCLAHHAVMVWSSARPHNVIPMVKQLFNPKQQEQLVGVWSRKDLRLGEHYEKKVQVYKQLTWLWDDVEVQAGFPAPTSESKVEDGGKEPPATKWDQSNTVLIDDSIKKAASEPHNLLQINEFTPENKNDGTDALGRVLAYIENLKWEANVSSAMREQPFVNGEGDEWDWVRNLAVPAEGVKV